MSNIGQPVFPGNDGSDPHPLVDPPVETPRRLDRRTAFAMRRVDRRGRAPTGRLAATRRLAARAVPVAIALATAACGAARTDAPVPRPFPTAPPAEAVPRPFPTAPPAGAAPRPFPTAPPAGVETRSDAPAASPGGWSGADFPRYLALVEEVETGGDCLARPAGGSALGCYQMTRAALVDAGFKDAAGDWRDNPWDIDSDDEFQRNRRAQDAAMLQYTARNWLTLEPCVRDLIGKTVGGVALDQAALVAGAHLLGATGVVRFVRCGLHARCLPPEVAAGNGGRRHLRASALRRMRAARGLRVLAPAGGAGSGCGLRG